MHDIINLIQFRGKNALFKGENQLRSDSLIPIPDGKCTATS